MPPTRIERELTGNDLAELMVYESLYGFPDSFEVIARLGQVLAAVFLGTQRPPGDFSAYHAAMTRLDDDDDGTATMTRDMAILQGIADAMTQAGTAPCPPSPSPFGSTDSGPPSDPSPRSPEPWPAR
jgi:hypothetical protein